jgi:hypothetical protein
LSPKNPFDFESTSYHLGNKRFTNMTQIFPPSGFSIQAGPNLLSTPTTQYRGLYSGIEDYELKETILRRSALVVEWSDLCGLRLIETSFFDGFLSTLRTVTMGELRVWMLANVLPELLPTTFFVTNLLTLGAYG